MMGKTHVAMGVATSLAVFRPDSTEGILLATIGGAVGGIICDIDTLDNDYKADALVGQLIAVIITLGCLLLDQVLGVGIVQGILGMDRIRLIASGVLFAAVWLIGFFSKHRTFSHSLLALVPLCIAVGLILPKMVPYFAMGFATHIILDLLNKKDIRLFYPAKVGFCFNIFNAQGKENDVLMWTGCIVSIILIILLGIGLI